MYIMLSSTAANMISDVQIEKLQAVLSDEEPCRFNFASFDAIPLPLDPEVRIKGIIPDSASLFKVTCTVCFQTARTLLQYDTR